MAFFTKKQFAENVGIPTKDLSNYIKRGKVICVDDLIDDTNPENRLFLENRSAKKGGESAKIPAKKEPETNKTKPNASPPGNGTASQENLLLKNSKLQEEIDLLKAKKEKIYELVIPREHASFLIKNYSEGIKSVWLTATETFLTQVGTSLQLSREEIIEHKKYIIEIMNDAVKSGAELANNRIRKLARDFAGRKGKGEHE